MKPGARLIFAAGILATLTLIAISLYTARRWL
jgi:hypothetical protein